MELQLRNTKLFMIVQEEITKNQYTLEFISERQENYFKPKTINTSHQD